MRKATATPIGKDTIHQELSVSEKDGVNKRQDTFLKEKPLRDWALEIMSHDEHMPRFMEDVIDVLSDTVRGKINRHTLDRYNLKKEIRARKPEVI